MPSPLDDLPKITAYLIEPDAGSEPLLRAIGQLVTAGAGLEHALLLAIALVESERGDGDVTSALKKLEWAHAGRLLGYLRKLDVPQDLVCRIDDVIGRRNEIIHRLYENTEMVRVICSGEGVEQAVMYVEAISCDCTQLTVELAAAVVPGLEKRVRITFPAMVEMVTSLDLDSIDDPRARKQLEALRSATEAGMDLTPPWEASDVPDGSGRALP